MQQLHAMATLYGATQISYLCQAAKGSQGNWG
jgi:hypothetical protein